MTHMVLHMLLQVWRGGRDAAAKHAAAGAHLPVHEHWVGAGGGCPGWQRGGHCQRADRYTCALICTTFSQQLMSTVSVPTCRCKSSHETAWPTASAKHCAGRISMDHIKQLYDLNSVVMAAARMPQIIKNFRVGVLSDVTTVTLDS
jgi:hypothetical protein